MHVFTEVSNVFIIYKTKIIHFHRRKIINFYCACAHGLYFDFFNIQNYQFVNNKYNNYLNLKKRVFVFYINSKTPDVCDTSHVYAIYYYFAVSSSNFFTKKSMES